MAQTSEANDSPASQRGNVPPAGTGRIDEIVVTGSLIRGLPSEYIASPVFSHDLANVEQSGAGSLSEYILTIPQNFTGDLSDFASSASQVGSTLGSGTAYNQYDGFAGFALRGLASDATLTLMNGRRMASVGMIESPSSSIIPSALIERIDIIPDGASATYGSDAVAGVVNIVTRKVDGLELRLRGSRATETGSKNRELALLTGKDWSSGNAYGTVMHQRRGAYVEDPIVVSGTPLQITQLPNEDLASFFGGLEQDLGDFTLSIDTYGFRRDRDARINYPDDQDDNRFFDTGTSGYGLNGNLRWHLSEASTIDLYLDYGRNDTRSRLFRGLPPYGVPSTDYSHDNELFVAELTAQSSLLELPAGPVLVAGGLQYREEELKTGAAIFFHRNGGRREVNSVFGEINVPLVSPARDIPLVRSLTLTGAIRYEDIGVDDALAPKLGLRWELNPTLALRGTFARSFLVPRFRDTFGIAEQVSFWNYNYDFLDPADQNPALPDGNALVMFRSGANPDLGTQDADTFTLGFDFTPETLPGLTLSAGYYRIEIAGRVIRPAQNDSVSVADMQVFNTVNPDAALVDRIVNNPTTFRWFAVGIPFVNDGNTIIYNDASEIPSELLSQVQVIADIRPQNYAVEETDGIDFKLSYDTELSGGELRFDLSGQYILNLDLTASGGQQVSRLDGYAQAADLRLNGSLVWGRDGVSVGTVLNYIDGFTDNRPGQAAREIGSYTTASLFLGFDLERFESTSWLGDSELQFVLANALNAQPPRIVDSVLGFDPYNNPPNPRTIGLQFNKRMDW